MESVCAATSTMKEVLLEELGNVKGIGNRSWMAIWESMGQVLVAVAGLDAPPHALQQEVDEMAGQVWVQAPDPDRAAKSAIPRRKSITYLRPPANRERCWGSTRIQRKRQKPPYVDETMDVHLSEAEPEPPVKELRSWDRHDDGHRSSRRRMSDSM